MATKAISASPIISALAVVAVRLGLRAAVLRAVGAGRRQVFVSVLGEAAVIGLIASLLGLAAGLALSTLAGWAIDTDRGFELIVSGRTVGIGFGIGLGVTLLSALFPALKAIRVSPVAAMRDTESDPSRSGLSGLLMGLLALGVGPVSYTHLTLPTSDLV